MRKPHSPEGHNACLNSGLFIKLENSSLQLPPPSPGKQISSQITAVIGAEGFLGIDEQKIYC